MAETSEASREQALATMGFVLRIEEVAQQLKAQATESYNNGGAGIEESRILITRSMIRALTLYSQSLNQDLLWRILKYYDKKKVFGGAHVSLWIHRGYIRKRIIVTVDVDPTHPERIW